MLPWEKESMSRQTMVEWVGEEANFITFRYHVGASRVTLLSYVWSTGKFQSCCLCIQASGYEEEKADVSALLKEGSAHWKLWELFFGKEMQVKIWLRRSCWHWETWGIILRKQYLLVTRGIHVSSYYVLSNLCTTVKRWKR